MKDIVNIGYIGLGRRGKSMLRQTLRHMDDIKITYLCDTNEARLNEAVGILAEKGIEKPILTNDYKQILQDESVDAVFIMTDWSSHCSIAKESALAGKYTALEVGCAYDIKDCFDLVEAYEKTGAPVMMLENCCYGRRELMILNMVKQGLFGELVHCDGAYRHFLCDCELFLDLSGAHYRLKDYVTRNCEQYPTHALGPIAKVLSINRDNRMVRLNSIASKSAGIREYVKTHLPDHPEFDVEYRQGDIITTTITCANGETITLTLDTTLPLCCGSRDFSVRGTKGMSDERRKAVFLDGMKAPVEDNEEAFYKDYEHPLHKELQTMENAVGHGGMDWLVCRAFIESVKNSTNTPIDAYDTATWAAIAVLSAESIARNGAPVEIPDFTNGKWKNREPIVEGKYNLDVVSK